MNLNKENVFLPPVPIDAYKKLNVDPQMVCVRPSNAAFLYIESSECTLELTKEKILISTVKQLGDNASKLFNGVVRVQVVKFSLLSSTPCINARNNVITFWSSLTNAFHTVTIPEGYYNDPITEDASQVKMMDALIIALNSAATGNVFSYTPVNLFPTYFNLVCANGTYYFDKNCIAVKKGTYVYNLPEDDTPSNSKQVGPVCFGYTSYIDVCSQTLTKYGKIQNASTGYNGNIIVRLFEDITIPDFSNKPNKLNYDLENVISFSFNPTDSIAIIDFEIKDQWGDLYYVNPTKKKGFNWGILLRIEA